ncbi:antifreeze protein [Sulfitobacter sp. SK012]|uniref:antifreeze protein n=1 Tax=Sulfitobacter sp. SK012 TaxID=1389005 RepID=UPI000E0C72B9|nr:antifreeze protein [Sulfitobacter sp. SK012]AXI48084.1 antifreeze protein [Sulfitobacter sp. SK012]
MTPLSLFALQARATSLMFETQTVMALRVMGMSGAIPAHSDENLRMLTEKGPAMAEAFVAGNSAILQGKNPEEIMNATLDPLVEAVRANRVRLTE